MARGRFRSPSYLFRTFSGSGWVILLLWQRCRSFLSTHLLLALPCESEGTIPLVSRKHLVSSSTCLLPLWLSQSGSATFLAPEMKWTLFRVVPSQNRRAGFFRYH